MSLTPHHAKYFAHDLTRRATSGMGRLSMSLFDAAVDLNPHQIEAALFALQSPLSKGVILADEVGLGKTIEAGISDLRQRLSGFCKRTLRNQVTEYIRYTERRPITRPFTPSDDEHALYEAVSGFLQREDSYALPERQRHLTALILRKLLASSSQAIAATLDTLRTRLETLRDEKVQDDPEFTEGLIEAEEIEDDLLDEILAEPDDAEAESAPRTIDRQKLREEIDILQRLATWARSIGTDTKTKTLLTALDIGFEQMAATGAARKALIFTESRRTQEYLKTFLESHGYRGEVVLFNGTNGGPEAHAIYERWVDKNRDTGRSSGSRAVDVRTALIEHFRDEGSILLATEAAAEGINLQFCSLVINYDLPWNPQRIEQRIGRCHRYGQRHDVVVINFLNERNQADRRVLELLGEKFSLFSGVFGASLDQETMEKLFGCSGRLHGDAAIPAAMQQRLNAEAERHAKATVSRSLEQNSVHFNQACEKLEKWADDMVLSAEKALADTKEQIKALRRQARQAVTLEEQHEIQQQLQKLEKQQRRQRQEIFKAEDEIMEKRDSLIESLERRLAQHTATEALFAIRWAVE